MAHAKHYTHQRFAKSGGHIPLLFSLSIDTVESPFGLYRFKISANTCVSYILTFSNRQPAAAWRIHPIQFCCRNPFGATTKAPHSPPAPSLRLRDI